MSTLAVLALATPIFGFALTPPAAAPSPNTGPPLELSSRADDAATSGGDVDDAGGDPDAPGAATTDAAPADEPMAVADEPPADEVPTPEETAQASEAGSADSYASQMRQRAELMPIHRAFGIATWISMLATVTLGTIQYVNLYGFFGGVEDTPCVRGGAVFGDDQCYGVSWPHRISAITTTALYATTFTLSFMMPDPDHLDQGNSDYARNLSLHKTLRWLHMAGMAAQVVLGLFTANAQAWFGLDRANNFAELQAMATAHQVIGLTTFGLLTAAGAIMLF